MRLCLLLIVALRLFAQPPEAETISSDESTAGTGTAKNVLPLPLIPARPSIVLNSQGGVDWAGVLGASGRFLAIEHGFRLLTEPGTRSGLGGSFFENYGKAVGNLHGWADGDEFYVNYVGHPMQGSVAGFLWVQNDRAYRSVEFGKDRRYWRSRLRAAAFIWAYGEQFEIGPFSEASIGAIQAQFPQQGFVDHIITPAFGLAWMIGEDAVDKYIIERIEGATGNPVIRFLSRSALNPTRTFANVLQGNVPWHRGTRAGVLAFYPVEARELKANSSGPSRPEARDIAGPAPFEFAVTFTPERYLGSRITCLGGGGMAAIRLAAMWQLAATVGGCKMQGLEKNLSGDALVYMAGPRFQTRDWGRWSANLQFLVGGQKLTEERLYPETKRLLETAAARNPRSQPPSHADYTDETASNGFAVASGGGVNYKLNAALTIRVAELNYQHSWAGPMWGRSFADALRVSSGLVLRVGTW